jgi:hypothetical protein
MATKKEIVPLNLGNPDLLGHYLRLDAQIMALEKEKAAIADQIKGLVILIDGYDKSKKYVFDGLIITSHRLTNGINQVATFKAFSKPNLRNILFPYGVVFACGKDKDLAKEYGLLVSSYGDSPVIEVV